MLNFNKVGIRKYITYILFLFLSFLLLTVDFFSNKSLSNFIPNQFEIISKFEFSQDLLNNPIYEIFSRKDRLISENLRLKNELIDLRKLYIENQELEDKILSYDNLIENIVRFDIKYISTSLIVKNLTDELLISGGRNQNFNPGDVVINEFGFVVGYLGEVFNDYSILESFNSPNFSINAIDKNNNIYRVTSNGDELFVNSISEIVNKELIEIIYSDITFDHIGKFPILDLSQYPQEFVNNKLSIKAKINKVLTFQNLLFIPVEKWK